MFIGPSVMGSGDLGALPEPLHVLPAALLLAAERFAFATPALDPLAHLPRVPHPSVWWRLQERLPEFLLLVFAEQCPIPGTRIAVTTIPERLGASLVVTAGELLNPAPRVSGDLHHLGCALALTDEPEDLIVAAQDRVVGFAATVLQLFWGQVRFKLYRLWHNDLLYRRTWYQALQGVALVCKSSIPRPISLLCLALCCTVLRSRWYQSGIKRSPVRPPPRRVAPGDLRHSSSTNGLISPQILHVPASGPRPSLVGALHEVQQSSFL